MRPLDILSRLNVLFEEDQQHESIIVDLTDHDDAKRALDNCRGPCVGWDDYINGRDYVPPKTVKGETPYGPRDGTAFDRSHSPIPENPHSAQYGGVRPWNPDEVILVLLNKQESGKYFPRGLWSMINKYKNVAAATSKAWDPDDIMGEVLDQAWQAIIKDEGRLGTEFTKYLATNIDFLGGPSAGVYNEYRDARGILGNLSDAAKRARKEIQNNQDVESYDPSSLIPTIDATMAYRYKRGKETINAKVDPTIPAEKNRLGKHAKALSGLRDAVVAAIQSKDVQALSTVIQQIEETHAHIQDEEDIYAGEGISRGRIGSQPRDMPAIGSSAHRWNMKRNWNVSINGENVGTIEGENETRARHNAKIKWADKVKEFNASQMAIPASDRKDVQVDVTPIGDDSGAGSTGVSSYMVQSKKTGDTAERSDFNIDKPLSIYDDPEAMNTIKRVLVAMRTGGLNSPQAQAKRASSAIDELLKALASANQPIKRRYVTKQDERLVRRAGGDAVKAGGYEVVDTTTNDVVARTDDDKEAESLAHNLNNPAIGTLRKLHKDTMSSHLFGDYTSELRAVLPSVYQVIKAKGKGADAVARELSLLMDVADQDLVAGGKQPAPILNMNEYRLALRKLGVDDYPERGTLSDPERDESGNLSLWARSGYPPTAGVKEIAADLGISPQRVSQVWAKLEPKLLNALGQIRECLEYDGKLTESDNGALLKARRFLIRVLVEGMRHAHPHILIG